MPGPLDFARLHSLGAASVREVTGKATAITDDRPSLEFHDPGPARQDVRTLAGGGPTMGRDMARALEVFFRQAITDRVPLVHAREGDAASLARGRERDSRALLGRLWAAWGAPGAAWAELESAARLSPDRQGRAAYLAEASQAALAAGRSADAERLAAEAALVAR